MAISTPCESPNPPVVDVTGAENGTIKTDIHVLYIYILYIYIYIYILV
jgi:hypothetical protein